MKKPLSLLLSVIMLISMLTVIQTTAVSAETTNSPLAQETVQGGAVLHCFGWSYRTILSKLSEIKAAGYTAVQTSPVQPPKDYSSYNNSVGDWWKFYQPLGFRVAESNQSWLGGVRELTALCTQAESMGIKVIVDIVANHLAEGSGSSESNPKYASSIDQDLQKAEYFHDPVGNAGGRKKEVQSYGSLPDVNTGNQDIMDKVFDLLAECVDCGVDGFRFDAAKHIELPSAYDGMLGSDFWQYETSLIRSYCEAGSKPVPFMYGELLGTPAGSNSFNGYLAYLDAVTTSSTGESARGNVVNKNFSYLSSAVYDAGTSAENAVVWAESHDTYMNNGGASQNVSNADIVRTWAVVGSRKDSTSLFFARPNRNSGTLGSANENDTTWKSTEVKEVNKFKNLFNGQSEYLSSQNNVFYNVRGSKGVVIVADGATKVTLPAHGMADGTYTDHVNNTTFTVSGGRITGDVGSSGVAVVYDENNTEDEQQQGTVDSTKLYLDANMWDQVGAKFGFYVYNNNGNTAWSDLMTKESGVYSASIPSGNWTKVIFVRLNDSATTPAWASTWNQTGDLSIPANDSADRCYRITSWDGGEDGKSGGEWNSVSSSGGTSSHTHDTVSGPDWSWANDFSSATATFKCSECNNYNISITDSDPEVETKNGVSRYTATVRLNGVDISASCVDDINGTLYLNTNKQWTSSSSRYAMYFFDNTNSYAWVSMTETDESGVYSGTVPEGNWTNVIFVEMKGSTIENSWTNKNNYQTADLAPLDANCFTLSNVAGEGTWSKYNTYTDALGNEIDLSGTLDRDQADTYFKNLANSFKNLQILGVQKKDEITDNNAVRYVAVVKDSILKDANDYGFIAVAANDTDDTMQSARDKIANITVKNVLDKNKFSCIGESNTISGGYGDYYSDKDYKYVTFAVNNIGDTAAVAVKFYVTDTNGNTFYADYTNKSGVTFNNCSANWAALMSQAGE